MFIPCPVLCTYCFPALLLRSASALLRHHLCHSPLQGCISFAALVDRLTVVTAGADADALSDAFAVLDGERRGEMTAGEVANLVTALAPLPGQEAQVAGVLSYLVRPHANHEMKSFLMKHPV